MKSSGQSTTAARNFFDAPINSRGKSLDVVGLCTTSTAGMGDKFLGGSVPCTFETLSVVRIGNGITRLFFCAESEYCQQASMYHNVDRCVYSEAHVYQKHTCTLVGQPSSRDQASLQCA